MENKKICVYLRVANSSQLDDIEGQKGIVDEYVKGKLKNSFAKYYSDNGYSGRNFDRPGMSKLINAIEKNKVDILVVNDYSRIGRNIIELNNFITKYIISRNIQLISIKEGIYQEENEVFNLILEKIWRLNNGR